jgi:hypothetical protein
MSAFPPRKRRATEKHDWTLLPSFTRRTLTLCASDHSARRMTNRLRRHKSTLSTSCSSAPPTIRAGYRHQYFTNRQLIWPRRRDARGRDEACLINVALRIWRSCSTRTIEAQKMTMPVCLMLSCSLQPKINTGYYLCSPMLVFDVHTLYGNEV